MSDKDFVNLCKSGNVSEIEAAINNGANVNARRCRQNRKYMIVYKKFLLRVKKIYEIRTS
ncbi:MAG: hypothetical protein IJT21_06135 [Synergistaceae bacterium]|nr:hypothetical protein [Synergistaceae bacterium]